MKLSKRLTTWFKTRSRGCQHRFDTVVFQARERSGADLVLRVGNHCALCDLVVPLEVAHERFKDTMVPCTVCVPYKWHLRRLRCWHPGAVFGVPEETIQTFS